MQMTDALSTIKRGTDEILTESDLKQKLESGKQLTVKAGFDPTCLLYTSPSPRDRQKSRMPSSA